MTDQNENITNQEETSALRRAKKMLAMAESNSPEEAANAMAMISKYITKYGFTMEQLRDEGVDKKFGESFTSKATKAALPNWYLWIGGAVANITDTRAVRGRNKEAKYSLRFQGMNGDDEVALAMFEYLISTMDRQLKAYKKTDECKAEQMNPTHIALDFRRGFAIKMIERSNVIKKERKEEEQKAQEGTGSSLMVIKQQLISDHYKGVGRARKSRGFRYRSDSAYGSGVEAANNTSLNKQVRGGSQKLLA